MIRTWDPLGKFGSAVFCVYASTSAPGAAKSSANDVIVLCSGEIVGVGEDLGLTQGGHGHSGRAVLDLAPGDLDGLVRFGVRPQPETAGCGALGHGPQVPVQAAGVHHIEAERPFAAVVKALCHPMSLGVAHALTDEGRISLFQRKCCQPSLTT